MTTTPPPVSPVSPSRMHRGVEQAVGAIWDCRFVEADEMLEPKSKENPRYSLEYANMHLVKGLMNSTNEQREAMLEFFQTADHLASNTKYGAPMLEESDASDDEEIAEAGLEDHVELTDKERKKLAEKKKKEAKERKEKEKEEFKKAQKAGTADKTWKLECEVIYADALLVRSVVQLQLNYYMKGGYNLKKTWGCYHALIKEVENDDEGRIPHEVAMNIKYGTGLFYCYLALVPSGLMKVLSAIGFISDQALGEQYLTEVINSGTVRAPSAALILCTYYLFLPTGLGDVTQTLAKAKVVLDKMNEMYPNNCYFWGYANFYHRKLGNTEPALESIIKSTGNAEKTGAVPLLLHYLHGDTLYMAQQWAEARDKYKFVLNELEETGQSFAYTGQVALSLAGCYLMLGDEDAAKLWVKRVPSMYNQKSKQDANSVKIATRINKEPRLLPLLGVYVLYINRDLAHMTKEGADSLQKQLHAVADGKDMSPIEVQAMFNLFVGVMDKGCGRKVSAMQALQAAVGQEKKLPSDSMVPPYTYYEMAEMEYRDGNMAKSKELFDKGLTFKGDGNETLANRYGIAMKQLKKAMEAAKK